MKSAGKRVWLALLVIAILVAGLVWLLPGGPYYRGRPVAQWAVDYSKKLYPSGTIPLSPSQRGLEALRGMGPRKAATAMIEALTWNDSTLYERYRAVHPRLPAWYRNQFPLRLSHQDRMTLILGATDFLDRDYQMAMVPFLIADLEKSNVSAQVAVCQLLANMPSVSSPAFPLLRHLSVSPEPSVSQAAQSAINRIILSNSNSVAL